MADTPDRENLAQAKVYLQQTIDERIHIFGSEDAAKDDAVYKNAKAQLKVIDAKLSGKPKQPQQG